MMQAEEISSPPRAPPPPSVIGLMPSLYKSIARSLSSTKPQRRHYVRIDRQQRRRRSSRAIKLGGFGTRIPRRPRLRLRRLSLLWMSPLRVLKRLRDAYVNMMLALASRDMSGAVMGATFYNPSGLPMHRTAVRDSRKEDELLAYLDYIRRTTGRAIADPIVER